MTQVATMTNQSQLHQHQHEQEQLTTTHKTLAHSSENPDCSKLSASKVTEFYNNGHVLITGASGFLGKVLLWKLIETCPNIEKIYVLIRSKNNLPAQKRLIQLLKGKPFSFKYQYTDLLQKIVAIESDITEVGLGLSQSDRTLLEDKVNIVFHSAASVKFDAPLKENLRDNVYGTRSIIELCNNLPKLKALVHVSTAYSNCNQKDIGEDLQPLKLPAEDIIKLVETLPDDACELVSVKLLEGRPNTYTYTKAIAEHLVAKQVGKYPITIVRPSIVISSFKDPTPGWVDNINGISGLGALAAVGLLRTIDWDYYATSDMVPVDYVANCLICAAYQVNKESPKKLLIYNMTSGNMNPVSWGVFFEKLRATATKTPPTKILRPMIESPKYHRANPLNFLLIRLFSELLFAYMIDLILAMIGYKKILVKITQKMHHGYRILKPFTTNQWNFSSDNVVQLSDSLSQDDKNLFAFDMRNFDWDLHAQNLWAGCRLMLLKEEPSAESYKSGKRRQTLVTLVHYGFIMMFLALALYTGTKVIRAF